MQLQRRQDEIKALECEIVAVGFEPLDRLKKEVEQLDASFVVLSDPELTAYKAYHLEQGSFWAVFNPVAALQYLRLLLKGRRVFSPHGNIKQLGGDFVIDGEGILRYAYRSARSQDRPDPDVLMMALKGI